MRVLHLVWTFSPLTETFVYDVVAETATRADVLVVTRRRVDEQGRPFGPVVEASRGGLLGRLRDHIHWRCLRDGLEVPSCLAVRRTLTSAVRSFRPDVIHAQFGSMGALAAPVAARHGIPLLTTFHGCDASRELREEATRKRYRALTAGRNRVIAVASSVAGALASAGLDAGRIVVLRNGKRLSDHRFRERSGPPVRFVTVGRLVEKKGHRDALEALARLADQGRPVELEIIGEGPLRPVLQARAAALGLGNRVRFLGALDHLSTLARMEASDAILLCSRTASCGDREGLPMVLLEAQALGLPCVSTVHAGIPEGIPAGNHWLLAPEADVDAIAAVLGRLCSAGPEEIARVSRLGLAHVRANHDLTRQIDALMDLYRAAAA